jgi:hypothetical protein
VNYVIVGLVGFYLGFIVMWVIARMASRDLTQEVISMADSLTQMAHWRNDLLAAQNRREAAEL